MNEFVRVLIIFLISYGAFNIVYHITTSIYRVIKLLDNTPDIPVEPVILYKHTKDKIKEQEND